MAEGVHTSMLAFESPLLLSVMALSSALGCLLLWQRLRAAYLLCFFTGWLLLCVYWALLAISAGPTPLLSRADLVLPVRVLGLFVFGVMIMGNALMAVRLLRVSAALLKLST